MYVFPSQIVLISALRTQSSSVFDSLSPVPSGQLLRCSDLSRNSTSSGFRCGVNASVYAGEL